MYTSNTYIKRIKRALLRKCGKMLISRVFRWMIYGSSFYYYNFSVGLIFSKQKVAKRNIKDESRGIGDGAYNLSFNLVYK